MITKLLPDQIAGLWEFLGPAVFRALPPMVEATDEKLNNILASCMKGEMSCWVVGVDEKYKALVMATVVEDSISESRSLLIYSVSALQVMQEEELAEVYEWIYDGLRLYADAKKCHRIMMYTMNEQVLDIVESFGGTAQFVFATLPIEPMDDIRS